MASSITTSFRLRWFLFFLLVALAGLQLLIVVLNHYYYRTYALDYAIYNFAFFDFAHWRLSPVPAYIYPFPSTFLQDHFSLTLPLLSPLYWLLNPIFGSYSLLILQWVFIVIGAWATFKFVAIKSSHTFLPYGATLLYFIVFGRYSAYLNDVNLAIIGASLIPLLLYYFETDKYISTAVLFLLLLLNREDYALWLFFIAVFLVVIYRKDRKKRLAALYMGLAACIYFVLVMWVFIPALEDEHRKYNLFDFSAVGATPLEALVFMFKHPIKTIQLLFVNHSGDNWHDGRKIEFYTVYLISGGVLLFIRPAFLLPFIPVLLKKMFDDNPLRWSIEGYYSIEFASLMPLLIFWILAELKHVQYSKIIAVLVLMAATSVTIYKIKTMPVNAIVGQSNKYNFIEKGFYKADVDRKYLHQLLHSIADTTAVCASGRLLPHLANRKKLYYFPRINDATCVVVLKKNDYWPLYANEFESVIDSLKNSPAWTLNTETNEILMFYKKKITKP